MSQRTGWLLCSKEKVLAARVLAGLEVFRPVHPFYLLLQYRLFRQQRGEGENVRAKDERLLAGSRWEMHPARQSSNGCTWPPELVISHGILPPTSSSLPT